MQRKDTKKKKLKNEKQVFKQILYLKMKWTRRSNKRKRNCKK